jgi:NADH-quinone oxidoreductase subunit C
VTQLSSKYVRLAEAIESKLGDKLARLASSHGELGYQLAAADLTDVARVLRDDDALRFESLMDLCGVDYLS